MQKTIEIHLPHYEFPQLSSCKWTAKELGLVADPVIEAIARLEFEDGLRTGVFP